MLNFGGVTKCVLPNNAKSRPFYVRTSVRTEKRVSPGVVVPGVGEVQMELRKEQASWGNSDSERESEVGHTRLGICLFCFFTKHICWLLFIFS